MLLTSKIYFNVSPGAFLFITKKLKKYFSVVVDVQKYLNSEYSFTAWELLIIFSFNEIDFY